MREELRELAAYSVEEPDLPVRLHANESPYNLGKEVIEEISRALLAIDYNRYPDPECMRVRNLLAERLELETGQILFGNGSDELIQMIIMAFGGHNSRVIYPFPAFSMYRNIALAMGEKVAPVFLDGKFELDLPAMKREVAADSSITFISYPNNPTGNCFNEEAIEEVIKVSGGIVVIDEAYYDYSGKTFLKKLKHYPNLIILRTFSKIGLASLRLGILISSKEIVDIMNRVRLPYNIGTMASTAAEISIRHAGSLEESVSNVIKERKRVCAALRKMDGIEPFRTDSNFILFRAGRADMIFERLIEKGVLVRDLNSEGPLRNCLRVTIGKPQENDAFIDALTGIVHQKE